MSYIKIVLTWYHAFIGITEKSLLTQGRNLGHIFPFIIFTCEWRLKLFLRNSSRVLFDNIIPLIIWNRKIKNIFRLLVKLPNYSKLKKLHVWSKYEDQAIHSFISINIPTLYDDLQCNYKFQRYWISQGSAKTKKLRDIIHHFWRGFTWDQLLTVV